MRKPCNYDTIHIGEIVGEKEVLITDEMIRTGAQAIESTHPWYCEDAPYGGRIAPPASYKKPRSVDMVDELPKNF